MFCLFTSAFSNPNPTIQIQYSCSVVDVDLYYNLQLFNLIGIVFICGFAKAILASNCSLTVVKCLKSYLPISLLIFQGILLSQKFLFVHFNRFTPTYFSFRFLHHMGSFGDRCRKDKQIKNLEVSYLHVIIVIMNKAISITVAYTLILFPQHLCVMCE